MNQEQLVTAEQAAQQQFIVPAEDAFYSAVVSIDMPEILDDANYDQAGKSLVVVRSQRKSLAAYFKEAPKDGAKTGPGQGLCYFARQAWEAANSLFNKFDGHLKKLDETLDGAMKKYRTEVERKAREEAEAKARAERERLEREAAELRRKAEEERKAREAEARAAAQKLEAERQARLKAEMAAAKSKREQEEARRRAEEEKRRAEEAERRAKAEAEAAQLRAQQEAEEKLRAAESVKAVVDYKAPISSDSTVKKVWKAEVTDLKALIGDVAAGKAPVWVVTVDQPALNKLAAAASGKDAPSGVRYYQEEITVSKRGR
jgi:flagellar biosynthesis GTPase FlhF